MRIGRDRYGFASSIRTSQYRSANSTRLRPTSRPRRQSAGGVASKRRLPQPPSQGPLAHHPSLLSKCHSRSQPSLAIGREQSRDLPDDAKKACYPDCGGSPCGRRATDRLAIGIVFFALSIGYVYACDRLEGETVMIFDYSLAAVVTAGVLVYLTYALLKPERF
jgi:K+-transporting ATPase KdpF subunit